MCDACMEVASYQSMRSVFFLALIPAVAGVALFACSGVAGVEPIPGGASAGRDGASPGTEFGGTPDAASSGPSPSCATATYAAQKAPLGLSIMLDRSASMGENTSAGTPKWPAAKSSITGFLAAASPSLSVGISFFPQRSASVPPSCTTTAQCGAAGPCGLKYCLMAGPPQPCSSPADCGGSQCVPVGECSLADKLCIPTQANACGVGGGSCLLSCIGEDSCDSASYAKPAVPIGPVGQTKVTIQAALDATKPHGETPTSAALAGALTAATEFAASHPGYASAVALVTDGIATECADTDPQAIARIAAAGAKNGVKTFVIGIFAPSEETTARANLDAIAKGGGTNASLIVKTSSDVAKDLAGALDDIRKRAVPCAYAMPVPTGGRVIDRAAVNVVTTPKGQPSGTVPHVDSPSKCGEDAGWFYSADEQDSKIVLCPKSCATAAAAEGLQIDIVTGCQTVVR